MKITEYASKEGAPLTKTIQVIVRDGANLHFATDFVANELVRILSNWKGTVVKQEPDCRTIISIDTTEMEI